MNITLDTKLVGFVGKPLRQSFSQKMHNAAFEKLGMDYFFLPSEIEEEDVGPVLNGLRHMNYVGLSVTKPYKLTVIPFLDEMDDSARFSGAVNCIHIRDGKLIGYNTDGEGFLKSLEEEGQISLPGKTYFMSGAGGAARAICMALALRAPGKILITGRRDVNSSRLVEDINREIGAFAELIPAGDMDALQKAVERSHVLINASGLGMAPHLDETPVPQEWIRSEQIACDLTYNPLKTRFLAEAEENGCRTLNGMGMLVNQGVKAFELWTGQKAPEDIMRKIVYQAVTP